MEMIDHELLKLLAMAFGFSITGYILANIILHKESIWSASE